MDDLSAVIANAAREKNGLDTGQGSAEQGSGSYLKGFAESALSSIPETIGIPPTPGAEEFRQQNPIGGLTSELAGGAVPYIGYGSVASKIPMIESLASKAEGLSETPLISGALRNIAFWAPGEAVRAGASIYNNPDDKTGAVGGSLVNLGIEGTLGGFGAALGAGGKVLKAEQAFDKPTASLDQSYVKKVLGDGFADTPAQKLPAQQQLRVLNSAIDDGHFVEADHLTRAKGQQADLANQIRWETVGENAKAVSELEGGQDVRDVNRLFKEDNSAEGTVKRSRLVVSSSTGFASKSARDAIADAAGLTDNWDAVSLPRYVSFGGKGASQAASKVQGDLLDRAGFAQLDDNTLAAKEKSGLYVMAKKVTGTFHQPAATDEWVMFKTDQPGRFVPGIKSFTDNLDASSAFLREPAAKATGKEGLGLFDKAVGMVDAVPMQNFAAADGKGLLSKGLDKATNALGMESLDPAASWLASRGRAMVEHYITPTVNQFSKNPVAKWSWIQAKAINDLYQKAADEMLFGEAKSSGAQTFAKVFKDPETTGVFAGGDSVSKMSADLTKTDISQILAASERLSENADTWEQVPGLINQLRQDGQINQKVADWLTKSTTLDKHLTDQISALEDHVGVAPTQFLPGHSMISRTWEGDYRSVVTDADGRTLYVSGARDPGVSDKKAQAIIDQAHSDGMTGLKLLPAEKFDALNDVQLSRNLAVRSTEYAQLSKIARALDTGAKPKTFEHRNDIAGYQKTYSPKEFLDKMRGHVNDRYKYMGKLTRDHVIGDKIQSVLKDDPKTYETLMTRLSQLDGNQGWFSKAQNQLVDKIAGPALGGKNSASKIVDIVNGAQYGLNFGFFNLGFPATNALTFLQTVMPEVAFVAGASDNAVKNAYYDSVLMLGKGNKPRGVMAALSPVKMTYKSMQEMFKPSADTSKMLDKAISEGVIDPKLSAEFVGDTASYRTHLKDVMNGKEPFVNFLKSVSSFLPEQSERFARGQAFITGKLVAQDVLGIADEDRIYRFAKQFTQRTMYGYNTYDRPLAFTGPLGRAFGLFKNWQAHYIGQMLTYAGEASQGNFAPLLWQMAGTASVGGIAATPLAGAANAFSHMYNNKGLMENFYSAFGNSNPDTPYGNVQDAAFYGLPAFLGVSLTGSTSAPGSNPARDAAALLSFPQWDRAKDIATFMGDATDTWVNTGENPAKSPDIRNKLVQAFAPKTVQRYWSSTDNQIRSLRTGNTIESGLSLPEMMLYKLGLTPRRVGISYAANEELWNKQEAMKSNVQNMGRLWMEAQDAGDTDTLVALTQKAMVMGVPIESVAKSANSRREKHNAQQSSRQFDPLQVQEMKQLGLVQ